MAHSYFISLKCSNCENTYNPDEIQTFCKECNSTLLAEYDLETAKRNVDRDQVSRERSNMWRWKAFLPVRDPDKIVTLGEGDTPLLRSHRIGAEMGLKHLFIKDEGMNPTGTFKSRGMAAAISKAHEFGLKKIIIPTAGNAGSAMAAYSARAGQTGLAVMPADAPQANQDEVTSYGGEVKLVEGLISDAGQLVNNLVYVEDWFNVATFKEPYRVEGKKIMGYELAEHFDWQLPDVIVYPTGGGTGLVGMWKAFEELAELGWLESDARPRMVAVQADGCAPVVHAFENGADTMEDWQNASTIAGGLRVPNSFADRLIMEALYESHGTAVAVSDAEILEAKTELAVQEGISAAIEGAATLAGLKKLTASGWVKAGDRVVLFNTGTGLKD